MYQFVHCFVLTWGCIECLRWLFELDDYDEDEDGREGYPDYEEQISSPITTFSQKNTECLCFQLFNLYNTF